MVEGKLHKELIEVNETNMKLENKADELERKVRSQQEQIYELKEQLTHNQADLKLKTAHFDGTSLICLVQHNFGLTQDAQNLSFSHFFSRACVDGETKDQGCFQRSRGIKAERA